MDKAMAMPIEQFLSSSEFAVGHKVRIQKILQNFDNLKFLGQLARMYEHVLLREPNCGVVVLNGLKEALWKVSLGLNYVSTPVGPLEKAALESMLASKVFEGCEWITSSFVTVGDVANASKAKMRAVFRKNKDKKLTFDGFLSRTAETLHTLHLTGTFEN